ncbi:coproporphyrinogen III oxidase [Gemmata obscuriglobus]|nr:coproporphyrinogen III oxidase [Gemmata obscuriglobus]VTS11252.1 radical sam domain protein : Fe-S oxidoreductase OS=uncultured planctomycete GN=HGMM_F13D05C10 PE=4 SV=1: B12-binding: Radical_SAM [Gemmata obscuriglobus UQM 2246]
MSRAFSYTRLSPRPYPGRSGPRGCYNQGMSTRRVLLVQLPIPPLGPAPIRGNVPLAGAYLKLYAETRGLGADYDIEVFPAPLANTLGDRALAEALAARGPWLVGFTCYLWNVERTLWVARELKRLRPGVKVLVGGPEITTDNAWVLGSADYDFAAVGEGEQTFAALLLGLLGGEDVPPVRIDGLYVPPGAGERFRPELAPKFRTPLPDLDRLGSPYLAGVLDAADERMLLLETTRGCVFNCKFCYYPKSYDKQYYLSTDLVSASLAHARTRGAEEVFLLDPTLNQRKDFAEFVRLLARGNPGRKFKYFGELRAEGITPEIASLLAEAGFTEVEVGLQSVERDAMDLMARRNNLKAFEKGVRALIDAGISVTVDLIVGLPGDTEESVRRGFRYLRDGGLYSRAQVFNLAVLPGTAFRHEAGELGLHFQPRPPYYVLRTPTLDRAALLGLMHEAQDVFDVEFDAAPPPVLDFGPHDRTRVWRVDLDGPRDTAPAPAERAQALTLWFRAADLPRHSAEIARLIRQSLDVNPYTTLQVVLEPSAPDAESVQRVLGPALLNALLAACLENPTYLDKFYALLPGRPNGAKRLVVLLPLEAREATDPDAVAEAGAFASVVWRGAAGAAEPDDLEPHEYVWAATPIAQPVGG